MSGLLLIAPRNNTQPASAAIIKATRFIMNLTFITVFVFSFIFPSLYIFIPAWHSYWTLE